MALNYTDINTIKNWFKTGLKPTQNQFWSTWESYWHKSEMLPISSIDKLGDLLDGKAETEHTHSEYAKNDATSLTTENVTAWQKKLGVADLKFDDKAITTTQNYADFGLVEGASINAFNNAVYAEFQKKLNAPTENATNEYVILGDGTTTPKGDLGKNFANTDLEITENRKHTGTASVELATPMIYSNASQRFSGLIDKSSDATCNALLGMDNAGNAGKLTALGNVLESGLQTISSAQALRIGQLLNGGQGSAGMMSVTSISPPVVEKIDSMEYLLIRGTNLYLNVTSMSIEIVKSSDNTTIGFIPNSQIQLYDNGLSLVIGYNFKDLPFGNYKLKITSGVKVLITTLTLRVVENVEHINIDTITWDVVTNSSYDFTNKYTVAGRSLWVKSPFTGVDSNVPIFSAKSSTLFNAGENFVIEFTMNYAAQNNFGSTVHTRFGLTSSDLTNILNYISLAYFNFWCMGGSTIKYNAQGVNEGSKSSYTSGTLDCKIVKNGNLFTLMIESMIYVVTISNNNNYSFIFQMPDRKFAYGGEEDTILITKAYKYN